MRPSAAVSWSPAASNASIRLLELVGAASLRVRARPAEAEQRVGAVRVVPGSQLELRCEEAARRLEGVHAERPLACLVESLDRLRRDVGRLLAERAPQLDAQV